jgi:DNA-3-methyladenine glycosylase
VNDASGARHAPQSPPYPLSFYARPADVVARELLGSLLHAVGRDGRARWGRIVETEAYVGAHDLACHAARGRTPRTEVMFGPAGRAYVYLVYGLHELFNVVTGDEGDAQAVLVRAIEPGDGVLGPAGERRGDGPARLTRLLDIDRRHYGARLDDGPITIHPGRAPVEVARGARIGVAYAGAWAAAPLRFLDAQSDQVSVPLRGGNSSRGARRSSRTPSM